jgi:hypothetical protein
MVTLEAAVNDIGFNETAEYAIRNLKPSTTYQFKVKAQSIIGTADSDVINVKTLPLPVCAYHTMYSEGELILYVDSFEGNVSLMQILECKVSTRNVCEVLHNLSHPYNATAFKITLEKIYILALYQSNEQVYQEEIDIPGQHNSTITAISVLFAVSILLLIMILLWIKRSLLQRFPCKKKKRSSSENVYYNSAQASVSTVQENTYEPVTIPDVLETPTYTDLKGKGK